MANIRLILTEDVHSLGSAGDLVRVKPGYARNYLLPQGKAMIATAGKVRELEHQRRVIEEKLKKEMATWDAVAKRISDYQLEFSALAGEEGKLFGSVTSSDIGEKLQEKGVEVDRRKIVLNEPIKALGDYEVTIKLHRDVEARVKVSVIRQEE